MTKAETDRHNRIVAALMAAVEQIAAKAVECDPANAEVYRDRLASYEPVKKD